MKRGSPRNALLLLAFVAYVKAQSSVLILSENKEQVVTSSTLSWVSVNNRPHHSLKNAVVGAYQVMQDENEEDNSAIESVDVPSKPVYVCRANQNGIFIPGQLRPNESNCIVSVAGVVTHASKFEVLINVERAARISWVKRDKFILDPPGAVTGSDELLRTFVARRSANSHNKKGSLSHYMGSFNPEDNLGKYTVVDQNDKRLEYEDGEILVETEPIKYELKDIKINYLKKRVSQERVLLGQRVLKNDYSTDGVARVDAVISNEFNYTLYWGHGRGSLTGLPLTVHLKNGTKLLSQWGLSDKETKTQTFPVEHYLAPGTAVNVSVWADYGEWDCPYSASLVSIYKDGEKLQRVINDNQRETTIRNVVNEFERVYFLHNNSLVPTTTPPTTTSSTTTTTEPTTTTTTKKLITTTEDLSAKVSLEADNIQEHKGIDITETIDESVDQNSLMIGDDSEAQYLETKSAKSSKNEKSGSFSVAVNFACLIVSLLCALRLT